MKAIVACDPRGGIGYQNKLPWNKLEGDLTRFKELTTDGIVIMGRNTWDSLPRKPLANRTNVVATSSTLMSTIENSFGNYSATREEYLFAARYPNTFSITNPEIFKHDDNAWVIGGAKLINSMWSLIDTVHLSRTYIDYHCDAFIDLTLLEKEFVLKSTESNTDHSYEIWKRK
jgi:dihydrofolate reductase